jgi:pimeloyl-ACP methyl ester carboxylesterase
VVICHGFKGFKDWAFFPALARAVARRGHAAVSFDFSRAGVSAGGADLDDLERFAETTHSRNVDEIRMVLDAITGGILFPRAPERIGLLGHSRGGGEAIVATAEDRRVDALVTWNAVSAFGRWSAEQVATWERGDTVYVENKRTGQRLPMGPGFWRDLTEQRDRLDVLAAAARIEVPWLIAHGEADETVDVANGRALFDAAGESAELLLVEGAGHTFGATHPLAGTTPELQTVVDASLGWLDQHLLPAAPTAAAPWTVL